MLKEIFQCQNQDPNETNCKEYERIEPCVGRSYLDNRDVDVLGNQ